MTKLTGFGLIYLGGLQSHKSQGRRPLPPLIISAMKRTGCSVSRINDDFSGVFRKGIPEIYYYLSEQD